MESLIFGIFSVVSEDRRSEGALNKDARVSDCAALERERERGMSSSTEEELAALSFIKRELAGEKQRRLLLSCC